ncbi:MAG TPA: hypothetical protein VKF38_14115 [Anaerolineaceae bacterium]|nr:hypothetical protein [Anaerolineaceae bacterium]
MELKHSTRIAWSALVVAWFFDFFSGKKSPAFRFLFLLLSVWRLALC